MNARVGWKVGLFCLLGGSCFTMSAMHAGHFWWWWLDGILIAAALLPIVRYGPRSVWEQFWTMAAVLVVVGLLCTMSEGVLFLPETRKTAGQVLFGGTAWYAVTAAVLVVLAKILKLNSPSASIVEHRSAPLGIPMVLLSGLSYVLYYLVFGAIAFQFFTKKYYPHAAEQVGALGNWFWVYQWGRGLLMTLAVLAVIYTLRLPRWKAALAVGIMIWIVGGGAPLLVPSALMVPAQRYMHIVEIMTQNVSLGMTAVWFLRPKTKKVAARNEQAILA
jgi:hypothetical protein